MLLVLLTFHTDMILNMGVQNPYLSCLFWQKCLHQINNSSFCRYFHLKPKRVKLPGKIKSKGFTPEENINMANTISFLLLQIVLYTYSCKLATRELRLLQPC